MSRPSGRCFKSAFKPAILINVGYRSHEKTGILHVAAGTLGDRMIRGTRMPPSYSDPLPDRSGALLVTGLPGCFLHDPTNPPLSEKNTTIVRSAIPFSSSLANTRPT